MFSAEDQIPCFSSAAGRKIEISAAALQQSTKRVESEKSFEDNLLKNVDTNSSVEVSSSGVNFINVKHTNFSYERRFSTYI